VDDEGELFEDGVTSGNEDSDDEDVTDPESTSEEGGGSLSL